MMRKRGRPLGSVSKAPPKPHHLAIVARRRAGETLQSIANDFGITRERVRQIANKLAPDIDRAAIVKANRRTPKVLAARASMRVPRNPCRYCGEPCDTEPAEARHHSACYRAALTAKWQAIADQARILRAEGKTWVEVGEAIGDPNLQFHFARSARRAGVDISDIWNYSGKPGRTADSSPASPPVAKHTVR